MNTRDGPDTCRDARQTCVLEAPSWEAWEASGRGGANAEESRRLFLVANDSFAAGLRHRTDEGACTFGHTDHVHASLDTVAACRPHYEGDTCSNPAPTPFVCVCVTEKVAVEGQNELGEQARFYFFMLGSGCVCIALFMILMYVMVWARECMHRRLWARGGLRYAHAPSSSSSSSSSSPALDKSAAQAAEANKQVQAELAGLWQCACCTTFALALFGGPMMLYLALHASSEYWVGCGFRVPAPPINLVVARPEFAGQTATGR